MNTMFFNAVSCFFVCAGLIIALILAIKYSLGAYRAVGTLFCVVCLLYFWYPER